jgi:hypothetical protein
MATDFRTLPWVSSWIASRSLGCAVLLNFSVLPYQEPIAASMTMPISATIENQARLCCPNGSTMKAASSGPSAVPKLPPT